MRQREIFLISNVIPEEVQEASLLQIDCHVIIQIVTEKDGSGGCGGGTEKGGYVVIGLDLTRLILQLVAEDVKHTANSNNGVIQKFVLTSFV